MTQIWVAMCIYLMVAYLKFCRKLDLSIQPIIRLFQVTYLSEQTCGDYSKIRQALLKLRSRCSLHSHESLWDSSDELYTAVVRAVLPCTHEKMTIFSRCPNAALGVTYLKQQGLFSLRGGWIACHHG